jgi:hypothetical protein
MGSLCILNTDSRTTAVTSDIAKSYICDLSDLASLQYTLIAYPLALTTTSYGLWWNGGTSYTIVGGFSGAAYSITEIYSYANSGKLNGFINAVGTGFIVDYDSSTKQFSRWTPVSIINPDENNPVPLLTHLQGISGGYDQDGNVYKVVAIGLLGSNVYSQIITLVRTQNGRFLKTSSVLVSNSPTVVLTSIGYNGITGADFQNAPNEAFTGTF